MMVRLMEYTLRNVTEMDIESRGAEVLSKKNVDNVKEQEEPIKPSSISRYR